MQSGKVQGSEVGSHAAKQQLKNLNFHYVNKPYWISPETC